MRAFKLSEAVRPVSDLKAHGGEIVRQVTETGQPVVLSRHGRAVAVVLSVAEYEALQDMADRTELQKGVEEAERDIAEGRTVPHDEVMALLRRWAGGE
jgi:prevent-host-death family protein